MKKTVILAALTLIAMASSALAADTNTLTVQANVLGTCKFVAPKTSTLNFGALDPSVGANVNGSTTTQFWCTKGVVTDAITADTGLNFAAGKNQMLDAVSGDVIPYTLALVKDGNANTGPAAPRTLTINGQVLGADYTTKSAGSYSDTVILSINP